MPRKTAQTKSAKAVETKPKEVKSKTVKEKVEKKVEKVEKKVEKKVKAVPKEEKSSEPSVSDVETSVTPKKKRLIPTKESVHESFDELISSIDDEISRIRESQGKAKGVKYLRSLGKKIKTLKGQSTRVMKQRQRTNRKNNNNSGFLKPVQISKEMAGFTGWEHSELKSRVDVTKYICKYIRDNDLQNPQDRRQILADSKLSKLLEYDKKQDDKPLTYHRIQTYMKKHFTPGPVVPSSVQ